MNIIKGNFTIYFDVDETIAMWNTNSDKAVPVDNYGMIEYVKPHSKHIAKLKTFAADPDTTIVVWSQGGWEWAKNVVEAFGLTEYVDLVINKPEIFVDDLADAGFCTADRRIYLEDYDLR